MVLNRIKVEKETALNQIHVVGADNTISIGVDAFPAMWDRFDDLTIPSLLHSDSFHYLGFHIFTCSLPYGVSLYQISRELGQLWSMHISASSSRNSEGNCARHTCVSSSFTRNYF